MFALWRSTFVQNVFLKVRGGEGSGRLKKEVAKTLTRLRYQKNTNAKQNRNVLFVLTQITRIEYLCHHLILTRERLHANHYTDTPCGEFIKALRGNDGPTEIVIAAKNEVRSIEIDGIYVLTDDLEGIGRYTSEVETDGQASNRLFALMCLWRYYYKYFILFFYHDFVAYIV